MVIFMIDTVSLIYMVAFFILAIVLLISISVLKNEKSISKLSGGVIMPKNNKKQN